MLPFRLSRESLNANASPSISLERGGYRMRAPRSLNPVTPLDFNKAARLRRTPKHQEADLLNRNLSLLLALLVFACVGCFGTAYYLFSSRWGPISWHYSALVANGSTKARARGSSSFDAFLRGLYSNERFLSYLPHSGFHNQRIAFENALVLARLLNRTLLVPPVHFSTKPTRYLDFDSLFQTLVLLEQDGTEHCRHIRRYLPMPVECLHYFDSTQLLWNELFDLSEIASTQRLVYLRDFSSLAAIHNYLSPKNILFVRDQLPYQYRFVGAGKRAPVPHNRYQEDIAISSIGQSSNALVQVGTLFGSSRLLLSHDGANVLKSIRTKMAFNHPALIQAATAINMNISDDYLGIHLRVGDGRFLTNRGRNIQRIWCTLLRSIGYTPEDITEAVSLLDVQFLETNGTSCSSFPEEMQASVDVSFPPLLPKQCPRPQQFSKFRQLPNPLLFISTDLQNPQYHPLLKPFLQIFPCTFFISDFVQATRALRRTENPMDGVNLYPFLLPLLDAMIVAKAQLFVGTPGSTFSKFIQDTLRPAYRHHQNIEGRPL